MIKTSHVKISLKEPFHLKENYAKIKSDSQDTHSDFKVLFNHHSFNLE